MSGDALTHAARRSISNTTARDGSGGQLTAPEQNVERSDARAAPFARCCVTTHKHTARCDGRNAPSSRGAARTRRRAAGERFADDALADNVRADDVRADDDILAESNADVKVARCAFLANGTRVRSPLCSHLGCAPQSTALLATTLTNKRQKAPSSSIACPNLRVS